MSVFAVDNIIPKHSNVVKIDNLCSVGASTTVGNQTVVGTFSVTGASTIGGTLVASGNMSVVGNSTIAGNQVVSGTMTVTGNSTFRGNQMVSGTVSVIGDSVIGGNQLVSGVVSLAHTDVFSPEAYGAVGDGLTDDTAAIQSCITAHRNVVFGHDSIYRVTSTINIPSNRDINLNGSTILSNNGIRVTGTDSFLIEVGDADQDGLWYFPIAIIAATGANISIHDGKIAQGVEGINIRNSTDTIVRNVEIYYCGTGLLSVESVPSYRVSLSELYIHDCRTCAFAPRGIYDGIFRNIRIWNAGAWGIVSGLVKRTIFENVSVDYDPTYASFYLPQGFINKNYINWKFTQGMVAMEHTGYLYALEQCTLINCNWLTDGAALSTKIVNFNQCRFYHCRFVLGIALPNTQGTGIWTCLGCVCDDCHVEGLACTSYTGTGSIPGYAQAEWTFKNCYIATPSITFWNASAGGGAPYGEMRNMKMVFRGCEFHVGYIRRVAAIQ